MESRSLPTANTLECGLNPIDLTGLSPENEYKD